MCVRVWCVCDRKREREREKSLFEAEIRQTPKSWLHKDDAGGSCGRRDDAAQFLISELYLLHVSTAAQAVTSMPKVARQEKFEGTA